MSLRFRKVFYELLWIQLLGLFLPLRFLRELFCFESLTSHYLASNQPRLLLVFLLHKVLLKLTLPLAKDWTQHDWLLLLD